ncbi:UDP-galactose transporter [Haplosporangium sp. Z 767]|nr:UDP-galactose transporter [Haplosporangium sp. Z 767]KAF9194168.1 UDP-galactose transporter [Haplosporangium sp. Z 11]
MLKLAACVAGIYSCFLTWGYFQEKVSTTPYGEEAVKFKFFIFLNMVQAITASAIAFLYLKMLRKPLEMPSRMLLGKYFQVAFFNAIASPFSYAALKHIDYPTMILTKSCKLVPVMFMNVILYRRKFPTYKYVCVALITIGVSGFMLLAPFDEHKKKGAVNSSLFGMLLVIINLTIDGVTNSTQDQIFHSFKVTGQQMMCFMNLFMSAFMALWLINPFNPELGNALAFCQSHPAIIKDIILFCLCGALGQCFIFYTLEQFGSLSLVTVTVTRKLFTILLSVVAYGHILNISQWLMIGVVFSGIGLEAYVKRSEKLEKMGANLPKHSPKPDQISFSQVEMMKKDKIHDFNSNFVGMASSDQGVAHYGHEYGYNNGNSTQLLQPSQQYQNQPQNQYRQPLLSTHQDSQLGTTPFSIRASYVSSSATAQGISVHGGGGRQRTSVIAPKRHQ